MLRSIKNTGRLLRIGFILARHDALFVFEELKISPVLTMPLRLLSTHSKKRKGERLKNAIEALGPTFIKLGQALSTRADIIGAELAEDIASLRDQLPPFSSETAKSIMEESLDAPLDDVFEYFESVPIAAASIAQVHKAKTKEGVDVAVKILRPGIEKSFARDMELFFWLAEMIEQNFPSWRRLKPVQVIHTFQEAILYELDLRFEASAAVEVKDNTKEDEGFRVPEIYWQYTSEKVLTAEWVDGIGIDELEALDEAGHDRDQILERVASIFFKQVFRDGFFHADLHPGNLFIDREGNVVMVDFGIMGRLDWNSRMYVAEIFRGFLTEDYKHVAEVHFRAGYVPKHKSVEQFTLACMAITKPILGKPANEISVGKMLGQLFKVTETFEMETQPQLLLLQKNMALIEGIGRMLNPNVNMWQVVEGPIKEWAASNMGPEARVKQLAQDSVEVIRKLPEMLAQTEQIIQKVNQGGLKLHPDTLSEIGKARRANQLRWLYFAWVALFILASAIIYHD